VNLTLFFICKDTLITQILHPFRSGILAVVKAASKKGKGKGKGKGKEENS